MYMYLFVKWSFLYFLTTTRGPSCSSFVIFASIFVTFCRGIPVTTRLSTTCKEPDIVNGKIFRGEKNTYLPGDVITFLCDNVYNIIGRGTIKCMPDGSWSNNPPFCVEIECHQLQKIQNGSITPNSKTSKIDSTVMVTCDEGFQLHGNDELHCTINGTWTPEWMPYCEDVRNATEKQDNSCQEKVKQCENLILTAEIIIVSVLGTVVFAIALYVLVLALYRYRHSANMEKGTQAVYATYKGKPVPEANPIITRKTRRRKYYNKEDLLMEDMATSKAKKANSRSSW